MANKIIFSMIFSFLSINIFAQSKRILSAGDLWADGGPNAYQIEKTLIETLKKQITTEEKIFAPGILYKKANPDIGVLIAAFGGDGEHSEEYSWIFCLQNDKPTLISGPLPYFVSNIWWETPCESVKFTGEYIINFCGVCDGPDAAPAEALISIPITGVVYTNQIYIELTGGPYTRIMIEDRLKNLSSKHPQELPYLTERINHARHILDTSHDIY